MPYFLLVLREKMCSCFGTFFISHEFGDAAPLLLLNENFDVDVDVVAGMSNALKFGSVASVVNAGVVGEHAEEEFVVVVDCAGAASAENVEVEAVAVVVIAARKDTGRSSVLSCLVAETVPREARQSHWPPGGLPVGAGSLKFCCLWTR